MKKRKIPLKNYIYVALITILTVIITILLFNYYKNSQGYKNENIMTSIISEIKIEELETVITESHDVMIYLINSDNTDKSLEKELEKIFTKNNFTKDMVVLNLNSISEQSQQELKNKYFDQNINQVQLTQNTILFIKERKVVNILNIDNTNVKSVKQYINDNFYGAE